VAEIADIEAERLRWPASLFALVDAEEVQYVLLLPVRVGPTPVGLRPAPLPAGARLAMSSLTASARPIVRSIPSR
jgi:hypothetical protein